MYQSNINRKVDDQQDLTAHPIQGIEFFERVINSTIAKDGCIYACTAYEKGDACGIAVFCASGQTDNMARLCIPSQSPAAGQPALAAGAEGVALVWIEYSQTRTWRLMHTTLTDGQPGPIRCLWTHENLIMYPTLCRHGRQLFVSFTALSVSDQRLQIHYAAIPSEEKALNPLILTPSQADANRATMASNGHQMMIAWDTMSEKGCSIGYVITDRQGVPEARNTICRSQERWLSPFAAADNTCFYLSWIIEKDVTDPLLGIVDHQTAAGFARITEHTCTYLPACHPSDGVAAADLRAGLLGSEKYNGYYGLRRRPRPVISSTGNVYLVWETMLEPAILKAAKLSGIRTGPSCGQLMAQKLVGDTWGKPALVHQAGTNYAVPANLVGDTIPVVYLDLNKQLNGPAFCCSSIRFEQGIPFSLDGNPWARWQPYIKPANQRSRYQTQVDQETYQLYWADTHTHSVFSPDAEGEPDEMVFVGRFIADLDIMAIVDNDFYPFFGLTKLKWQLHLALADKHTHSGDFVFFPGYEYTFHDRRLQPDFNHRYILYPGGQGSLYRRTDAASSHVDDLMVALDATAALPVTHHTTWQLSDSSKDRHVEVCSSWRICKEESDFIDKRLLAGDRFSFIGSSDTHRIVPGLGGALTGVYARSLTPEAIFEAYRNHRVIATQGNRTVIDLRIADLFIGQTGSVTGDIPIQLTVQAEKEIDYVSVVRDGHEIKRITPHDKRLTFHDLDRDVATGHHYYYVTVKLAGDPSFNAPAGVTDNQKVFFSDELTRYPHNFARAEGPFAWCTPIWVTCS